MASAIHANVSLVPAPARFKRVAVKSGVDEKVCAHFSTRRQQIEAELDKTGNAGATASAMAALSTRRAKTEADRHTLHQDWQARASALGLEFQQAQDQS